MEIDVLENSIVLQTCKGTNIKNVIYSELPSFRYEKNEELCRKKFPRAIIRRGASVRYNCHGLTFANRRTCIEDSDDLLTILGDDEYKKISLNETSRGDIIVYKDNDDIDHTGIIIDIKKVKSIIVPIIMSKWGARHAEYIHPYNHCPYNKSNIEFWTERK